VPEALEEGFVELGLADLELNILELEGEVVGRAGLDVAGEDVAGGARGGREVRVGRSEGSSEAQATAGPGPRGNQVRGSCLPA
jgi:hypothetical protein